MRRNRGFSFKYFEFHQRADNPRKYIQQDKRSLKTETNNKVSSQLFFSFANLVILLSIPLFLFRSHNSVAKNIKEGSSIAKILGKNYLKKYSKTIH